MAVFIYSRVLALKLGHMLAIMAIGIVIILIISACWNYCSTDSRENSQQEVPPPNKQVIVSEVRPGLLIVHGYPSNEETLRIVQEYDSMRGHSSFSHFPAYGSMTENTLQQPAASQRVP